MNPADYARMAEECSRQADAMSPGLERDALMEKARQYRSYAKMDNWVASKELRPRRASRARNSTWKSFD
jgi:hypothetical protein